MSYYCFPSFLLEPGAFTDRQHVVALLVNNIILFWHVEFPEEVEGDDSVTVHDNRQQHAGEDELQHKEKHEHWIFKWSERTYKRTSIYFFIALPRKKKCSQYHQIYQLECQHKDWYKMTCLPLCVTDCKIVFSDGMDTATSSKWAAKKK